MSEKQCIRCGEAKPLVEFFKQKLGRQGVRTHCKPCEKLRRHELRKARPYLAMLRRSRSLAREKGWAACSATEAELEAAWTGKCYLCNVPAAETLKICMDHDHDTGAFRGFLCMSCNLWLGRMGDDPAVAADALGAYAIGCNYGFLDSKPIPASDISALTCRGKGVLRT